MPGLDSTINPDYICIGRKGRINYALNGRHGCGVSVLVYPSYETSPDWAPPPGKTRLKKAAWEEGMNKLATRCWWSL